MIDFAKHRFAPVINLPSGYEVYDHSQGYDPRRLRKNAYGVGKYNEHRPGMYATPLFQGVRDIHVGIDIAGPVGEPIYSFYDGEIFKHGYNSAEGDYGHVLITRHLLDGVELFALYGHLNAASTASKKNGEKVTSGQLIAWIGDQHENGGWNPHLHFQLSYQRPITHDMPGVVSKADLPGALKIYPDPRLVLGSLY